MTDWRDLVTLQYHPRPPSNPPGSTPARQPCYPERGGFHAGCHQQGPVSVPVERRGAAGPSASIPSPPTPPATRRAQGPGMVRRMPPRLQPTPCAREGHRPDEPHGVPLRALRRRADRDRRPPRRQPLPPAWLRSAPPNIPWYARSFFFCRTASRAGSEEARPGAVIPIRLRCCCWRPLRGFVVSRRLRAAPGVAPGGSVMRSPKALVACAAHGCGGRI